MDERTVTLENIYYRHVMFVIEELLSQIPRPAYIEEKPERKTVTQYTFHEPVRKEDFETKQGRVTVNYSQTKTTEFAAMIGPAMEKDPIVFECFQGKDNDQVLVKGYCLANKESEYWIMPIFEDLWKRLLAEFLG